MPAPFAFAPRSPPSPQRTQPQQTWTFCRYLINGEREKYITYVSLISTLIAHGEEMCRGMPTISFVVMLRLLARTAAGTSAAAAPLVRSPDKLPRNFLRQKPRFPAKCSALTHQCSSPTACAIELPPFVLSALKLKAVHNKLAPSRVAATQATAGKKTGRNVKIAVFLLFGSLFIQMKIGVLLLRMLV